EEATGVIEIFRNNNLDPVFLIAPTTTDDRMKKICSVASGFVYYVSLKGVTGAANLDIQGVADKVQQIRRHTDLPVGVGFGIKDAEIAAGVGAVSDAVVVGSALVKKFEEFTDSPDKIQKEVVAILSSMRTALDADVKKTGTK
ncbi:MAG: tryptophan synthase subunit alpha, partial [Gammaproteobacteria bacterium]|nr:tryptophan synthase subunit alpha [Gammaproteobacteria bacterium]